MRLPNTAIGNSVTVKLNKVIVSTVWLSAWCKRIISELREFTWRIHISFPQCVVIRCWQVEWENNGRCVPRRCCNTTRNKELLFFTLMHWGLLLKPLKHPTRTTFNSYMLENTGLLLDKQRKARIRHENFYWYYTFTTMQRKS